MNKKHRSKPKALTLDTQTLRVLTEAATACVAGGQKMQTPRTDCICHAQCATAAC